MCAQWYFVIVPISAYVGDAPALRCKCCWNGPRVLFRTATLTWSGSAVLLSDSQLLNDSSKLLLLNVGSKSLVR